MDMPTHILVYPNAGDFQKALEFAHMCEFDVHEGTVNGSRSLELFDMNAFSRLLTFSREKEILVKLYVRVAAYN